ncbi:MAG: hydroxyacid dehydrogenase [Candidatus Dactylopiibacterium carminicum]|uniref:FAD-binding oxidoreductase n=1 Tax=Candidatus Dactylopiibacterium carminicum TaxID=857335 RepID=A0A272EU81_9RHOO|nr:FAD-binding oxidoreductase [Candidatus Dactylopiibacterium carminicum]KAF7599716.1 FAD-binding oxidoreductase [Candidatus Dactylopiibacterium carminicum]PAS93652.1 MAG: hydroxyacid dehydrogenase [Candidatus Dactylopiibacterium carminicum]PAS97520.1 MAG: hydroxyacid dehydrogenase [Candidatus Dactylopiibacterium carminicum]PAS99717.1 MAG: hydroxyacid dehydrogenase [Candidatus Dactylopiibacterium carminicum]
MQSLIDNLRNQLGDAHVLPAGPACAPYEEDWRGRYRGEALCVARPASTEEVAAVVRACAEAGVPIVPQGGNTGLVGAGVPHAGRREVLLSLSRLNRIRAVDPVNATLTAEAGCTLVVVQEAARAQGRLFPLSLASEGSCQIGGNLAANAGGVQVLRYGNMRELTLGLEVVLADGRIWDGLRGLRKDNTGYDLKQLFVGSEGTLGVITAAVLKLHPLPATRSVAWLAMADTSAAMDFLSLLQGRCGERLSAFEIVSAEAHELLLARMPICARPLQTRAPWYALVELADGDAASPLVSLCERVLEEGFGRGWVLDAALAQSEAQAEALWALRENISEAQKKDGISIKHDISVPVSAIPTFLERADTALQAAFPGVRIVAFGHAGDGNLHYNASMREGGEANTALVARTAEVNRIVHDVAASLNGSISAEHGLGQLKREEIRRYKSPLELELMARIKQALDPRGLFNPGKLL